MTVCLAYPTGFELSQKFAAGENNRRKVFVANFKCSSNTRKAKVRKSEGEQTEGNSANFRCSQNTRQVLTYREEQTVVGHTPYDGLFGLPDRIRTCDLESRSLTRYPAVPRVDLLTSSL